MKYPKTVKNSFLDPANVKYLSFEGGGAKGSIYIGALAALAELGIVSRYKYSPMPGEPGVADVTDYRLGDNIKGVAGASAGAITATLLACGHTIKAIRSFLDTGIILTFYDPALPNRHPQISKSGSISNADVKSKESLSDSCVNSKQLGDAKIMELLKFLPKDLATPLLKLGALWLPAALNKAIQQDTSFYTWNLTNDFGLFSGCAARKRFDMMIGDRICRTTGEKEYGVTFERFKKIFGIDLVLTGSNLVTGKSQYFSVKETPKFKVVDALRISMSFPLAFKPVVIAKDDVEDQKLVGVWIDGGLLNNNPIHAFDNPTGVINEGMLGLRIGIDSNASIKSLIDFIQAIVNALVDNSEHSQIRSDVENSQTIQLDPNKIDTLDFAPDQNILKKATNEAAVKVLNSFGKEFNKAIGSALDDILP